MRFLFALAAVLCLASTTFADDKAEKRFKRLDTNGDNKLSVEEFVGDRAGDKAERAKKAFARLDKNNDKFLSLEEFKARKKKSDK